MTIYKVLLKICPPRNKYANSCFRWNKIFICVSHHWICITRKLHRDYWEYSCFALLLISNFFLILWNWTSMTRWISVYNIFMSNQLDWAVKFSYWYLNFQQMQVCNILMAIFDELFYHFGRILHPHIVDDTHYILYYHWMLCRLVFQMILYSLIDFLAPCFPWIEVSPSHSRGWNSLIQRQFRCVFFTYLWTVYEAIVPIRHILFCPWIRLSWIGGRKEWCSRTIIIQTCTFRQNFP